MLAVRSCIGRADDILAGQELLPRRGRALLDSSGEPGRAPHLFLLDEMFRGTNAVERIAAGQSVLGSW